MWDVNGMDIFSTVRPRGVDINLDSFSRMSGYCFGYRIGYWVFKSDIEFGCNITNIMQISGQLIRIVKSDAAVR